MKEPRLSPSWAFIVAGLLWVLIFGTAALLVNALT